MVWISLVVRPGGVLQEGPPRAQVSKELDKTPD